MHTKVAEGVCLKQGGLVFGFTAVQDMFGDLEHWINFVLVAYNNPNASFVRKRFVRVLRLPNQFPDQAVHGLSTETNLRQYALALHSLSEDARYVRGIRLELWVVHEPEPARCFQVGHFSPLVPGNR